MIDVILDFPIHEEIIISATKTMANDERNIDFSQNKLIT